MNNNINIFTGLFYIQKKKATNIKQNNRIQINLHTILIVLINARESLKK